MTGSHRQPARPTGGSSSATRAGATWLVAHGAALVGIDALNIDDTADAERPAHTLLLAAGIPVVEHLTGLGQLPPTGARFTALPLRIEGNRHHPRACLRATTYPYALALADVADHPVGVLLIAVLHFIADADDLRTRAQVSPRGTALAPDLLLRVREGTRPWR